ncbi:MAG: formate dehydrogenase-N subunit alpha, partial [Candidatus Omnitrophica bacterium]|nr:formate dehydrogenase-N subunit alpha [Candidatus Omnitrophota bacterium]
IHVDPRYTRTTSKADIYCTLRPGTDIPFVGGMINHILSNDLYQKEYVLEYTNASFLVDPKFDFQDGLFSGFNPEKKSYDKATWAYQLDENGVPKRDNTLQDPFCVFQLLKKHFSRYDVDMVCSVCGSPKEAYLKVVEAFNATGKPEKAGMLLYAMGATQHTVGTQNIRVYSILQTLLGNMGIAGGGINAQRGESNVQGATDHGCLFHLMPGYLKSPTAEMKDLATYLEKTTPATKDTASVNYWKNTPKFVVSLFKAWWGKNATKENEFCYHYFPKSGGNHSYYSIFDNMLKGKIKGLLIMGMNPAVGGANSTKIKKALDKLDWMVAVDMWETDTSVYWKRPGVDPKDNKTEVFLIPAAASVEKEGSISNSGRWMQWRYPAIPPYGESLPDLEIVDKLFKAVRNLYLESTAAKDKPILELAWDYGREADPHLVAKEINGYDLNTGKLLLNFTKLMDDGSTSCGCWIYSGSYTEEGNMASRRDLSDPSGLGLYPQWAWCWPLNRRILYNRASCDAKGNPWNPNKAIIKWDEANKKWITFDVPDFVAKNPKGETVPPETSAKSPFIMRTEGVACLFSKDLVEGPFPEHYEPYESPLANAFSSQNVNPCAKIWSGEFDKKGEAKNFPIICTTTRVTEHWQTGIMTRNLPWLAELMPEMFVEMSVSLAADRGIKNGDVVKVSSARGEVQAKACVTERLKPFTCNGKTVEMVNIPWHFGYNGYITGGPDKNQDYSANQVTTNAGDANTWIQESKAFLCDIKKVG